MKRKLLLDQKKQEDNQLHNSNKKEEVFEEDDIENSSSEEAEYFDYDEDFSDKYLEQQQSERDLEVFRKEREQEVYRKPAKQLQEAENEGASDKNHSQFFSAELTTQSKNSISAFKKNKVVVQDLAKTSEAELTVEQDIQILIPADGDCLYTTVFIGYLLPVINNQEKFSERLFKLTGNKLKSDFLRKKIIDGCHNVEIFKKKNFKKYILKFRIHMHLNDGKWGGENEIKVLANKLNIIIQEEMEHLNIPPIRTEPAQSEHVSETIYILHTNADIKEASQNNDDLEINIARMNSLNTAQNAQHYRLILKDAIPEFKQGIMGQTNESNSTVSLNTNQSQEALNSYENATGKLSIPRPKGLSNEDEKFIREEIEKSLKQGIGIEKSINTSVVERSPFYFPIKKIELLSPIPVIDELYTKSDTPAQKQACLRYLLHYQHYNAEFTNNENERLGYPKPLCVPQKLPGYFRTEYHRLFELLLPWVQHNLQTFYTSSVPQSKKNILDFINFGAISSLEVIKTFFREQMIELADFCRNHKENNIEQLGKIVTVRLRLDELKKDLLISLEEEIKKIDEKLKLGALRTKNSNLKFVFVLTVSSVDFVVMWGAKWAKPKKDNTLEFLTLNTLFGDNVFSLISKFGAVPDRLAVNQLLTGQESGESSSFEKAYSDIKLFPRLETKAHCKIAEPATIWNETIEIINSYHFENDNGIEIYRDAILCWNDKFFKRYPEVLSFAELLLCTQVKPWLTQDVSLVQWAKAYQNLCEIVLLSLDYFPELQIPDLNSIILQNLDPHQQFQAEYKLVGSHSYGMSTFFDIFYQINQRDEFFNKKISIACISQNYFEILSLMESLEGKEHVSLQTKESLKDVQDTPDILIADIHPNNASKNKLHQNDITGWIQNRLKISPDKKMILILDVTLNHLQDEIIQTMMTLLKPYIESGQLEFFGMQSLAKLIQFGADNFSGGLGFYLGTQANLVNFANIQSQKAKFFVLLFQYFQNITGRYFKQVRHNADWIYKKLAECFEDVAEVVTYKKVDVTDDEEHTIKKEFSAAQVTLNVDEGTVYVAIGFEPFFELIGKSDEDEKEDMVGEFIKLLLDMASFRGLPITGRQSFGFSLSNMSSAARAIRFSIGVENEVLLNKYIALLEDFNHALSRYAVNKRDVFSIEEFKEAVEEIYKFLQTGDGGSQPLGTVDLFEDQFDEYGNDFRERVGNVTVSFIDNQLRLSIQKDSSTVIKRKPHLQVEPHIGIEEWGYGGYYWPYANLFQLILQLKYIDPKIVYVFNNSFNYSIGGLKERNFLPLFTRNAHHNDKDSGITVIFEPEFTLTINGNIYTANNIFVVLPEFDLAPVRVAKLIAERGYLNQIYTKCIKFKLEVIPYDTSGVLLKFTVPKRVVDFLELIAGIYRQNKLLGIVNYLNNEIDFTNLPLVENQFWGSLGDLSLASLHRALNLLGRFIAKCLTKDDREHLQNIKDYGCKKSIIDGMYQSLFEDSCNKECNLSLEIAKNISDMFSLPEFIEMVEEYVFDDWLKKLKDYLVENVGNIDRVIPYLKAFFPIIQNFFSQSGSLCDTDYSISLLSIADKVINDYPELKKHVNELEQAIPQYVLDSVKEAQSINAYLNLYLHYPLLNNIKTNLLLTLSKMSDELLCDWINNPRFYYAPTDRYEINMTATPGDLIVSEKEQLDIKAFFVNSGSRDILLKQLIVYGPQILITAIRWAIMTQDEVLFSRIMECCKQKSKEIDLDRVECYLYYLKKDVDIQNQLNEFLSTLCRQATSLTSSSKNVLSASLELERDSYNQVATDIFEKLIARSNQKLDEEAVKRYILSLIEEAVALTPTVNEMQAAPIPIVPSFDYGCIEIERNLFRFFSSELRSIAPQVCKRWKNIASESAAPAVSTHVPTFQK